MEPPETLKLNPVNAVHSQSQAKYGAKKVIILEGAEDISLASAALTHNYIVGGHLDRDPMNTSFMPDSEHIGVLVSGAQIDSSTFIGHYPGLNADALDDNHPTVIHNSRFVLLKGRGYKFQIVIPIKQPVTEYQPAAVGKGVNLSRANFKQADLAGTDFTGCNLESSNFTAANLSGCNFTGANLARSSFNGADLSNAILTGANLAGVDFSSTVTSEATDFGHAYLVGARFYCLGGEKFAYLGCFHGARFTDGERRIEVANADFSRISNLVDGQFACFYKSDVVLPANVECISTNRFVEARETSPAVSEAAASKTSAAWGEEGF
ncbi:low-complexity protein [Leptolyngbya sp. Heron Island J]|uniref:pentapeptide repeat-containing protein n=1 Tax=Leptolyngbya sp. Heron Island J TaxID=1385935 RepID=UPI0003B99FF7|nr:pentapeptide repeat-containing protein [Leptolyngbya sp. Heron Island J]ESA33345.1 low-complexity protein [Leptolyngbya sp. Heron Island J]